MVVVFVTHNYPRHAGDLPGAFLQPLARALRDRGHDVRVVAPSDRGQGGREPLDGIPVRRVRYASAKRETLAYEGRMQDALRSPSGILGLFNLVAALRAGVRAEVRAAGAPCVVHAHWWFPSGLAVPRELPTVITLHGTDARLLQRSLAARWLGRRVLRRARIVTAVSKHLADLATRTTGRADVAARIQPMPSETAQRAWTTGGAGAILVARLTRQKRVDLAIRAVAGLAVEGMTLPLTIVGDGPERGPLERLAASLRAAGAIRFTGQLSPAAVTEALGRADVMLFPALGEGFGLAAAEALMQGVPVVAGSDGGGVVDLVQAHGGGIVTAPVPAAIADGIRLALGDELRAQARAAGEQWRKELAPNAVATTYEGWYREALGA